MNPDTFDQELAQNRQAYATLRDKIRTEYRGQYVAVAFGRIIHVSADFDEAMNAIKALEPQPSHAEVFPADEEPAFEPIQANYTEYS